MRGSDCPKVNLTMAVGELAFRYAGVTADLIDRFPPEDILAVADMFVSEAARKQKFLNDIVDIGSPYEALICVLLYKAAFDRVAKEAKR